MLYKKYKLDCFQSEACNYIDNFINPLVSAPTGSGKTAIAEYAIDKIKKEFPTKKIVYTCPIKSLCNEKFHDMSKLYPEYIIGLMTGDIIINPHGDIIIMTTEVLYNMIVIKKNNLEIKRNLEINNLEDVVNMNNIKCIIYDEVHYINDDDRGHVWEKCLIISTKVMDCLQVLLSATIGNIDRIIEWLNSLSENKTFKKVVKLERPVPLKEYFINSDNKLEMVTEESYKNVIKHWEKTKDKGYSIKNELNKLCLKLAYKPVNDLDIEEYDKNDSHKIIIPEDIEVLGLPSIIFVLSKKKCMEYGEMITHSFTTHDEKKEIINFFDKNLLEFESCSQYINLRKIIGNGIAYHHSGLIPKIREVVEFLIKNKLIKIVFATETFAVGLNFPVKTVVMTGIQKPTSGGGRRNLTVSEYKQMAGRAGRRFIDEVGNVIFWFYSQSFLPISLERKYLSWNEFNKIINGTVNNIESKFSIEPNYILKSILSNIDVDEKNSDVKMIEKNSDVKMIIDNSFMYYKSDKDISLKQEIIIPSKYLKLYEIEKNKIEFSKAGISFNDKNYKKLLSKLTKEELNEYNDILDIKLGNKVIKSDYEIFIEKKDEIIEFLVDNDFIKLQDNKYIATKKGLISSGFNEINSIIIADNIEYIFRDINNILPILSMFIDDGKINEDKPNYLEEDIKYFEELVNTRYKKYMLHNNSKWNFYPENYIYLKKWLSDEKITLDELCNTNWQIKTNLSNINLNLRGEGSKEYKEIIKEYNEEEMVSVIDMGLFVKTLIKMHQICDELNNNIIRINKADVGNYFQDIKSKIIRYPLKIESLYTK